MISGVRALRSCRKGAACSLGVGGRRAGNALNAEAWSKPSISYLHQLSPATEACSPMLCRYRHSAPSSSASMAIVGGSYRRQLALPMASNWGTPTSLKSPHQLLLSHSPSRFSTGTQSAGQEGSKDGGSTDGDKKQKASDKPNIFLDNLGKIFLGAIGAIILMLVRSSRATSNRTSLRDYLENHALLDPLELDDLRVANSELTSEVMEEILDEVCAAFPSGRATYLEFVSVVIQKMNKMKGEAFTIQLGHIVDRVAIAAIADGDDVIEISGDAGEKYFAGSSSNTTKAELPLPLLVAMISLALRSTVSDRVRMLFDVMHRTSSCSEEGKVNEADVVNMVGYLQRTSQLVPDAQIVATDVKYPAQEYRKGTPAELVSCAKVLMEEEGFGDPESDDGKFDRDEFHRILRTKQVCAWGECYRKTKNLA